MTDSHAGYIVTLNRGIREDDAEHIINALRMISGVASVQPITDEFEMAMARDRVRFEAKLFLHRAIDEAFEKAGKGDRYGQLT